VQDKQLLKKDLFGEVWLTQSDAGLAVLRDARSARVWLRWLARALLRREGRALAALGNLQGFPQLLQHGSDTLLRSHIPGEPMFRARPTDAAYFKAAATMLRRLHTQGIAHNDLAKEANILVQPDGMPGIIDFQLAWQTSSRGRCFRSAAMEDIRHLLKHKRTYRPDLLTQRERSILEKRSTAANLHRALIKPVYMFVTRRLLGWSDREGAADRGRHD